LICRSSVGPIDEKLARSWAVVEKTAEGVPDGAGPKVPTDVGGVPALASRNALRFSPSVRPTRIAGIVVDPMSGIRI
jgi:hypothetical protein